jgi:hypothetical protein
MHGRGIRDQTLESAEGQEHTKTIEALGWLAPPAVPIAQRSCMLFPATAAAAAACLTQTEKSKAVIMVSLSPAQPRIQALGADY